MNGQPLDRHEDVLDVALERGGSGTGGRLAGAVSGLRQGCSARNELIHASAERGDLLDELRIGSGCDAFLQLTDGGKHIIELSVATVWSCKHVHPLRKGLDGRAKLGLTFAVVFLSAS